MTAFDPPHPAPPTTDGAPPSGSLLLADWVFGYGSLIWNPGFPFVEQHLARLHGYHRAFCVSSTHYRGTPQRPGVVLGLDQGGSCIGMAFRLCPSRREDAIDALYRREMGGGVYVPRVLPVGLRGGSRVRALTFVANRASSAYARLTDDEIMMRLSGCSGQRGCNREYAIRTLQSLAEHGVHCPHVGRLGRRLLATERG